MATWNSDGGRYTTKISEAKRENTQFGVGFHDCEQVHMGLIGNNNKEEVLA